MNSVRPLITITILAVVGAWLYVKINQGPAPPAHDDAEAWHDHAVPDVPPLATTINTPPADPGLAPPLPNVAVTTPTASAAVPATNTSITPGAAPPATGVGVTGPPDMPAIPTLPDVVASSASAPPAVANAPPTALQANVPNARYPGGALESGPIAVNSNPATSTQPTNTTAPDMTGADAAANAALPSPSTTRTELEDTSAADSAMARVGLTPQLPVAAGVDRFGAGAADAGVPPVADPLASPVEPSFAAAWPAIQASLDRGELARAHQLLSGWYGDDSLPPAEAERVETLLGQLAGSVVYSTEHQLEPAYVVRPGETLESIAAQCQVPWQLLAKINGIPSADAVQPGQQLKIVRGPFSAVVELRRSQLTLMLDGRYAGKFPIVVPAGAAVSEGQWLVDQKLVVPSAGVVHSAYSPAPATVDRAIVLRGEEAASGKPAANGPTLTIASSATPAGLSAGPPTIRLSPQDAEDLSDILSVGSRIVIRR